MELEPVKNRPKVLTQIALIALFLFVGFLFNLYTGASEVHEEVGEQIWSLQLVDPDVIWQATYTNDFQLLMLGDDNVPLDDALIELQFEHEESKKQILTTMYHVEGNLYETEVLFKQEGMWDVNAIVMKQGELYEEQFSIQVN